MRVAKVFSTFQTPVQHWALLQESPYLLGHSGMGVKVSTYYRKSRAADDGHIKLINEADKPSEAWRYGQVSTMNAEAPSPFRMGDVRKGKGMLVVENGLSVCAAAAHKSAAAHDFLLVRRATGHMFLRPITGSFLVRPSPAALIGSCQRSSTKY